MSEVKLSLFFFKCCVYLSEGRDRERQILYLLVHILKCCNSQKLWRLKPGVRSSIRFSHLDGSNLRAWASVCCLQNALAGTWIRLGNGTQFQALWCKMRTPQMAAYSYWFFMHITESNGLAPKGNGTGAAWRALTTFKFNNQRKFFLHWIQLKMLCACWDRGWRSSWDRTKTRLTQQSPSWADTVSICSSKPIRNK